MCNDGLLDTSNFPSNHPLFSVNRKAHLGCIKDESGGCVDPYVEWIFLRPKCYSMLTASHCELKRAKGVQKSVIKNDIQHDDYVSLWKGVTIKQ
jgi:hypothetical protein